MWTGSKLLALVLVALSPPALAAKGGGISGQVNVGGISSNVVGNGIGGGSGGGAPPPSYTGLGDIVGGAKAYWGLRAYSKAAAGSKAVNLRRDSDNAASDFYTLASGDLDTASIAAFQGSANLFIVTLYDQTGNGKDFVQATAANQPSLTLNSNGTKPTINFNGSSATMRNSFNLSIGAADLISVVTFSFLNSAHGTWPCLLGNNTLGLGVNIGNFVGENLYWPGSESQNSGPPVVNSWESWITTTDGTQAPKVFLQAVQKGGSTVSAAAASSSAFDLAYCVSSSYWHGAIEELGVWPIDFSAAEITNFSSNQNSYW